jgi:LemA protein
MDVVSILLLAPLGAAAVVCAAFVRTFNRFVAARNACRNARSGIDVQLTKRHDLVPNLTSAVAGYAAHERTALEALTRARSDAVAALGSAASPPAEVRLDHAIVSLQLRVEQYPQLQASANFLHLQKTLAEIEEQISAARRAFNAHVMALNNLAEQFPTLIVARLMGFSPMEHFAAPAESRVPPAVETRPT